MEGYEYALQEYRTSEGSKIKTMQAKISNNETNLGIAVRTIKEFYR
jgi:hypothetical protein